LELRSWTLQEMPLGLSFLENVLNIEAHCTNIVGALVGTHHSYCAGTEGVHEWPGKEFVEIGTIDVR